VCPWRDRTRLTTTGTETSRWGSRGADVATPRSPRGSASDQRVKQTRKAADCDRGSAAFSQAPSATRQGRKKANVRVPEGAHRDRGALISAEPGLRGRGCRLRTPFRATPLVSPYSNSRRRRRARFGKFRTPVRPRCSRTASSYARAASSADPKLPSHLSFPPIRIVACHLPR
jgi:hypothetical protein